MLTTSQKKEIIKHKHGMKKDSQLPHQIKLNRKVRRKKQVKVNFITLLMRKKTCNNALKQLF